MVLVTGATGFLGSHLVCQLLAKGYTVRACRRSSSSLEEFTFIYHWYFPTASEKDTRTQQLQWVEADILNSDELEAAMQGANWVFHCAALVSFHSKDRDLLHKVNVEGTANVVNACLSAGVANLCYCSSVAALGRAKSGATMDENTHWENSKLNTRYAISKYKAELEVWRGAEEGLRVVMVNPGVLLGVGDIHKGSNAMIGSVVKGNPFYSMGANGYVDVKDVAAAMILLSESNIRSQRYVMVGENLVFKDLFFMIADTFGKPKPWIEVGPVLAGLAWRVMALIRVFGLKGLSITRETARAALKESYYQSDKVKKDLGFTFTPIKTTIQECHASLKNQ